MQKPIKKSIEYFDYSECRNYLQEKYGYDEMDVGERRKFNKELTDKIDTKYGKSWYNTTRNKANSEQLHALAEYDEGMKNGPPYLDFWHWVVAACDVSNGGLIYFSACDEVSDKPWINKIHNYYIEEFADKNGDLTMMTSW